MQLYEASASDIQVKHSPDSTYETEADAQQLLVRVLHRGMERAMNENSAEGADITIRQQRLMSGIMNASDQGTRPIDNGVWASVLERDFGGWKYNIEVTKRSAFFFWDKSLTARVESVELPMAFVKIDVDAYYKALRS